MLHSIEVRHQISVSTKGVMTHSAAPDYRKARRYLPIVLKEKALLPVVYVMGGRGID